MPPTYVVDLRSCLLYLASARTIRGCSGTMQFRYAQCPCGCGEAKSDCDTRALGAWQQPLEDGLRRPAPAFNLVQSWGRGCRESSAARLCCAHHSATLAVSQSRRHCSSAQRRRRSDPPVALATEKERSRQHAAAQRWRSRLLVALAGATAESGTRQHVAAQRRRRSQPTLEVEVTTEEPRSRRRNATAMGALACTRRTATSP